MLRSNNLDDMYEDIVDLIEITKVLMRYTAHYASMPHAHSDAYRDEANARAIIKRLEQEVKPNDSLHIR